MEFFTLTTTPNTTLALSWRLRVEIGSPSVAFLFHLEKTRGEGVGEVDGAGSGGGGGKKYAFRIEKREERGEVFEPLVWNNSTLIRLYQFVDGETRAGAAYDYRVSLWVAAAADWRGGSHHHDRLPETDFKMVGAFAETIHVAIPLDAPVYFNAGTLQPHDVTFGSGEEFSSPNGRKMCAPHHRAQRSRGLYEGLQSMFSMAKYLRASFPPPRGGGRVRLLIAAYEFESLEVMDEICDAILSGVTVELVYDKNSNRNQDLLRTLAERLHSRASRSSSETARVGVTHFLTQCVIGRSTGNRGKLHHHKFVVLVAEGLPVRVLTSTANFSEGGFYGQFNGSLVLEDEAVNAKFLACFEALKTGKNDGLLAGRYASEFPLPRNIPPDFRDVVMFPQPDGEGTKWFVNLLGRARELICMTAAFGIREELLEALGVSSSSSSTSSKEEEEETGATERAHASPPSSLKRMILLDKNTYNRKKKPQQQSGEITVSLFKKLIRNRSNRVACGTYKLYHEAAGDPHSRWTRNEEKKRNELDLSHYLNDHVRCVHAKLLLLDPLSACPTVVMGSVNFGETGFTNNDENMVVVRGDRRLARAVFTEFLRVFLYYEAVRGRRSNGEVIDNAMWTEARSERDQEAMIGGGFATAEAWEM